IYLDTSGLIYSVETHARYWPVLETLWQMVRERKIKAVSSQLIILEVLVGLCKSGNAALQSAYEQILKSPEWELFQLRKTFCVKLRIYGPIFLLCGRPMQSMPPPRNSTIAPSL